MKVTGINKATKRNTTNFKGRIIDSHTHLGKWYENTYNANDLDVFYKQPLANGDVIEKMIVSNLSCIEPNGLLDELQGNKELLEIAKNNPVLAPLAVCQPNVTKGDVTKIEQLLKENPNSFVGLKFHPKRMELPADDASYNAYMKLAEKYKLPCLFHSDKTFETFYINGVKAPRCEYSRPEQIYKLAQRTPKVPIILGHLGGNEGKDTKAAVDILVDSIENNKATLFADISWVNCDTTEKPDIIEAIRRLKNTKKGDMTERLLFGTDAPIARFGKEGEKGLKPIEAYNKVVIDVKNAIKKAFPEEGEKIIEKIFYQNAKNLFFKKQKKFLPELAKNIKGFISNKKVTFGGVSLLVAGTLAGIVKSAQNAHKETTKLSF